MLVHPTLVVAIGPFGKDVAGKLRSRLAGSALSEDAPLAFITVGLDDGQETSPGPGIAGFEGYGPAHSPQTRSRPQLLQELICQNPQQLTSEIRAGLASVNSRVNQCYPAFEVGAVVQVCIVSSLANPDGGAWTLPIALLVNQALTDEHLTRPLMDFYITGILSVAAEADSLDLHQQQANVYASLKELDDALACQYDPDLSQTGLASLKKDLGLRAETRLTVQRCFVLDRFREGGGSVLTSQPLVEQAAVLAELIFSTPLSSRLSGIESTTTSASEKPLYTLAGSAELLCPVEELRRYCASKLAGKYLDNLLDADSSAEAPALTRAETTPGMLAGFRRSLIRMLPLDRERALEETLSPGYPQRWLNEACQGITDP
jgi:hypothetical protein